MAFSVRQRPVVARLGGGRLQGGMKRFPLGVAPGPWGRDSIRTPRMPQQMELIYVFWRLFVSALTTHSGCGASRTPDQGGQWYSRTTLISGANAPRKLVRLPNRSRYPLLGANWSKSRQPMRGLRIAPSAPHPDGHARRVRKVNEAARANAPRFGFSFPKHRR
jgi:hypothetical protein